jgi:hypothetical protein
MNDFDDRSWSGEAPNLEAAFEQAWHNAKKDEAPAGTYKVAIQIVTENPIRGYIVTITQDD